jgi:hypothetical protein
MTKTQSIAGNTIATGWTFAQIPVWLLTNTELSDGAKVMFAYLKYRQGKDAACWPSYSAIAQDLGITERTAMNRAAELENAGYIERQRRPGRSNLFVLKAAPEGEPERWIEQEQNRQGGENNFGRGVKKVSGGGENRFTHDDTHEQEHDTTYPSGEENVHVATLPGFSKESPDSPGPAEDEPDGRAWFVALARTCSVNLKTASQSMRGQLGQSSKILRTAGASPDQIADFRRWWDRHDWRGKQGQAPLPHQVRNEWGRYTEAVGASRAGPPKKLAWVQIDDEVVDDPLGRTPREYEICRMPHLDRQVYERLKREGRTETYE